MRLKSFRPVTATMFLIILMMLGISTFLVNRVSREQAATDSDSTGTLGGAYDTNATDSFAVQTSEPDPSQGVAVPAQANPSNKPKPDETGVPTPAPTIVLPPMTPIPTNAVPDIWKNCPAFAGRPDYPTPAPGESTTCPTPVPHREPPTPKPNDPFVIRACVAPDPPDDPNITKRETQSSPIIVLGRVQQVLPPRWTTADGRRPADPHALIDTENMAHIVTPVHIDVEQYLKGQRRQSRIALWSFGGTIDQDITDACGSTRFTFQPGQRVIVFLKERGQVQGNDPVFDVITRYAISSDGQATVDDRIVPVQQLLDEIRTAVSP